MLRPMLASLADAPLDDPQLVYEPKYDGIRAIADVPLSGPVRLWSRLGNEKTTQFPEIAAALGKWRRTARAPVILDGEIVALDAQGEPTGFQQLQGRIHLIDPAGPSRPANPTRPTSPTGPTRPTRPSVAFILFDVLREGETDLCDRPLLDRRQVLERLFARTRGPMLRLSEVARGDGRAFYQRAVEQGWEGLIAKHARSLYKPGKRTPDWRKIKITREQEFVVGGWTEPRQTRSSFGALLLGVYDAGELVYVGHTGTGFNERELARVMALLRPLETPRSPFRVRPKTNERPHWVEPALVAQVRFTEWTADGKLRHPVYLGLRDDKDPREVVRETQSGVRLKPDAIKVRLKPDTTGRSASSVVSGLSRTRGFSGALIDRLHSLEDARRDGTLDLPGGQQLAVTNLHKVFWPRLKLTKGDLFRYYVEAAPYILPAVADRPLVMKRYPNGVDAKPFYQHRVADTPAGVRVETVSVAERRPQLVGGDLMTLLYMTQLAAISQDPWFSRVQSPEHADYVALDLDPPAGAGFRRTLEVARWIHDELEMLGAAGMAKTSGAEGLHVYIPLPPGTPYEAGLLFCQIIATVVAHKHPRHATVERSVAARGSRVYVDYLQNILGKTLATAYSARASEYAGVSTPLSWDEVHQGIDREDFTIRTLPGRLETTGDLWAAFRRSTGVDLSRATRYLRATATGRLKGESR